MHPESNYVLALPVLCLSPSSVVHLLVVNKGLESLSFPLSIWFVHSTFCKTK